MYRLVRNYDDSEEITFDTFIRCFRSLASFDTRKSFTTWLFTIAHNLAVDRLRKTRVHYELDESSIPDRSVNDPAEAYRRKVKMERIDLALAQLAPVDRELVILFHTEEKSYDEISEIVKLPVTTIKTRLHRARKRLAETVRGKDKGIGG